MSPPCDVAVYEQGVWFLRLSAVLLLASFTNYASLPSKRKSAPAVAQVEEIQEAVAVPAVPAVPETQQGVRRGVRQGVRRGVQGVRGGADISVPPLPNSNAKKKTKRRGVKGSRIEERQKSQASVARNQIRSGSVRKRRRAASQGKPTATATSTAVRGAAGVRAGASVGASTGSRAGASVGGVISGVRALNVARPTTVPAYPMSVRMGKVHSRAAEHTPSNAGTESTAQRKPVTISMHPSKIKHLQFSL